MEGEAAEDPPDDLTILAGAKILRRVVPGRYSSRNGTPEGSSFRKDGDGSGTSVTLWVTDYDLQITHAPHPAFGIIGLYVAELRAEALTISFVDEPGNPNHCEIFGERSGKKRERLAALARWVVYPEGYPDEFKIQPLWTLEAD